MRKLLLLSLLALSYQTASAQLVTESFGSGANAFSMDFVQIDYLGEATRTYQARPESEARYNYNLSKYEVSRDMINKANAVGNLGITLNDMSFRGGNGVNRPATGISWYEAAKFVNYLNTSTGGTAAYKFVDETFTMWSAGDSGYNANNIFRNSLAKYVIPSFGEWYKGAYGNPNGSWSGFPNGTDTAPTAVARGTDTNTAVYFQDIYTGPADINNAGGLSAYGTMGQGGNVWEWNETASDGTNNTAGESRGLSGGNWYFQTTYYLGASYAPLLTANPGEFDSDWGFRVAMIPEPSSLSLLALGGVVVMAARRRFV